MTNPWDQRLGETDSEYRAFACWLAASPRHLPAEPALAATHEWAVRAGMWDMLHNMPEDPTERLVETVDAALSGAWIQSQRWLRQLSVSHEPVDDPKQILEVLTLIARLKEVTDAGRAQDRMDLSKMTDEQLDTIDQATKLLSC